MTKFNNIAEVAQVRAENKAVVFNLEAALKAAEKAPAKARVGSGQKSERLETVKQILAASPSGLTMNQIKAAYAAGMGIELNEKESKKIYECVFQHSDACNNKGVDTDKAVFTRSADGVYSMK